ncbi:GNAT family N-acetyltransferase [Ruegeria denitrificans]|uniref:GNAT family N-acetyltransferase n=1 Tax=Ruegeria denitrificans TaxID=1715692 RepID=UPI003C7D903A
MSVADFEIINLKSGIIPQASELWHSGWHDAHAAILPDDLTSQRTLDSFAERLHKYADMTRVAVQDGVVLGLCIILRDEINQMYVSPQGRGTGLAAALLRDGEQKILANGHATGWLACAIGNRRAARFYEKCDWVNTRTEVLRFETQTGDYPLEIWRFEKHLN